MADDRLTALALMYVHPDIDIDVDEVIWRFVGMPAAKVRNKQQMVSDCTDLLWNAVEDWSDTWLLLLFSELVMSVDCNY